jgi:hypothetical protein
MSAALTILIVTIASGAADDPFMPAVERAMRQALGPDTRVISRPLPTLPSDAEVVALGDQLHADAVVEVAWSLPDHLSVTIRLERSGSGRWVERDIGFKAVDVPVERSRTVGFTVASMLPEYLVENPWPEERPEARAAPQPRAAPRGQAAQHARAKTRARAAEKQARAEPEATARREAPSPQSSSGTTQRAGARHRTALSGSGVAALGVRDSGTSVGGELDLRHRFAKRLWFRIAGGARAGEAPAAQAVTRFFYGGVGLAYDAWLSNDATWALGLRLDGLLVVAEFSRVSADDTTSVSKPKWIPGADLLTEACFFFTPGAAVVVAGGGEAVFGRTDVLVAGRRATTYEPVHPVVELGLRAGF